MSIFILPKDMPSGKERELLSRVPSNGPVPLDTLLAELGEPSAYDDEQYRWGNRQSLLVDIEDGQGVAWWSYEFNEGGRDVQSLIANKARYVSSATPFDGELKQRSKPERWTSEEAIDGFWTHAEAIRPNGESVATYLRGRGIDPHIPADIVRQGKHRSNQSARAFPALMIPLTDDLGNVVAVQAIRCPGGSKLEHVPKVSHGAMRGAAFRLPGVGRTVLCEGPEDALSIWQATGRPVICVCGKGNLKGAPVNGLAVDIWFDNDITVPEIEALVEHLPARSLRGIMHDTCKDANELIRAEGPAAVLAAVEGAVPLTPGKPDGGWEALDLNALATIDLPRIEWLIPDFIKAASACSMAGASNAGKTNWTALLVVACASGRMDLLGLEPVAPFPVAWVSNEETTLDLKAKLQAAMRYHQIEAKAPVVLRGNDLEQMVLVEKKSFDVVVNKNAVAEVIEEVTAIGAKLIIFDPFNTLQLGLDQNVAVGEINKLLSDIKRGTGAATLHIHHTPKERGKDDDWYVGGDANAWMGATQIYSTLDTGIIFARWSPSNKDDKRRWKALEPMETRRWVYTSLGKARGFMGFEEQLYRIESFELSNGQSHPVMVRKTRHDAEQMILGALVDDDFMVTSAIDEAMGGEDSLPLSEVHDKMISALPGIWPQQKKLQARGVESIQKLLESTPFKVEEPSRSGPGRGRKIVRK